MHCTAAIFFPTVDYTDLSFKDLVFIRSQLIDEFTDVNDGEKQLMKLWNLHLMKNRLVDFPV